MIAEEKTRNILNAVKILSEPHDVATKCFLFLVEWKKNNLILKKLTMT